MIFQNEWITSHILALVTTMPIFLIIYTCYGMSGIHGLLRVYPFILVMFTFIYHWMFKNNK